MPKFVIDSPEPQEQPIRLLLEQRGDEVIVCTNDGWNILAFRKDGKIERFSSVGRSVGFSLDEQQRVKFIGEV